jgi:replicative DNA helicase
MTKKTKVKDETSIHCDLEAEEQLLHYLAFEDISLINELDEEIFYGKDQKIIFEALKEVQSKIPKKLFHDTLWRKVGTDIFDDIVETVKNVEKAASPKTYKIAGTIKKDLEDLYLQREIITGSESAKQSAEDGYLDDAMLILKAIEQVQIRKKIDAGNYIDDFELREKLIKENAKKKGSESSLIPTGIIQYDKLSGGIQRGEVGILIGETGQGKSAAKGSFGIHAFLKGFNVAYFGYEMRRFESQFRIDSNITEIPGNLFRFASLRKSDYTKWRNSITKLKKEHKNFFEFAYIRGLTVSEALLFADSIQNKYGKKIDLLLFDYLALAPPEKEYKAKDTHLQQREGMIKLSDWAIYNQSGVWTSAQSTDEGIKRKGGMRTIDLKYSRAVAEYAQIIAALYQGKEDAVSGNLNFVPIKGRGFKKGTKLVLRPDLSRMILDTRSYMAHRIGMIKGTEKSNKKKLGR